MMDELPIVTRLRGMETFGYQSQLACEAADLISELETALAEIEVFATVRSKDDSATFARVNRGALRTIAATASKALAKPPMTPAPQGDRK